MTEAPTITPKHLRAMALPQPEAGSKDDRGRVLVVGGTVELPGAALLSGTAALRVGAGKLQIATTAAVAPHLGLAVPEARVIGLPDTPDRDIDGALAAERLASMIERLDAVLIGPGLTPCAATTDLTLALLSAPGEASFVLDAGSLSDLRHHADTVRARAGRVVITPHAGEMAGLLDWSREAVEADPVRAARTAAEALAVVVVMKGAKTWIVSPDGPCGFYGGGGIGLATSGSGDVLAGIVAGLLARGADPAQAAQWAVYLHGEAGVRLARSQGPLGFLARELLDALPSLLRDVMAEG